MGSRSHRISWSGRLIRESRLKVHVVGVVLMRMTSYSHGSAPLGRSQRFSHDSGSGSASPVSGRSEPESARQTSRRPDRCPRSAWTSDRGMLGSTSPCGRGTSVNASMAQPPAIHHGPR